MSRAFLLEPTDLNVHKAARFGTITTVFEREYTGKDVLQASFQDRVVKKLSEADFDPWQDYVIVSGRMTLLLIAVAAMMKTFGSLRLLVFDGLSHEYREVMVSDPCINHQPR